HRPPQATTLSLHDALPISEEVDPRLDAALPRQPLERFAQRTVADEEKPPLDVAYRLDGVFEALVVAQPADSERQGAFKARSNRRSEEHTSELQSRFDLVCR